MEIIYNSNDPNVLVIDTRESVRKVVLLISHNLHLSIERILITLAVVAIDASKSAFALLLACGKTNYAAFGKKINKQMNQTVSNGSTERAADNVVRKTRPLSLHVLAALANRRVSSIVKRVVRVAFVTSAIVTLVSGPSHSEVTALRPRKKLNSLD